MPRLGFAVLGSAWPQALLSFPFAAARRLGENSALVNLVERLTKLGAVGGTNHVASHFFEKREFLRARVEGDKRDLNSTFALRENLAGDVIRSATCSVLTVGDDQKVLAEHAGAIQLRPRHAHRL